jgi:VWFA-related protein
MSARHCGNVLIVAVLCYTCAALAQQAEETVLRVTTRLVLVSVVAHDRYGHLVSDLTRDDFTLTDNGRPQPISVFSVQLAERAESAPDQADTANPLVISNRTPRASEKPIAVTVILFDALNISRLDDFL